jgi:hypothetical protein
MLGILVNEGTGFASVNLLGLVSHPLKAIGLIITSFLALQNGTDKHQSIPSNASDLRQNQKNHPV